MTFICDRQRHLVCVPYSIAALHEMAAVLGIGRCWFHRDHYDIPKRMAAAVTARCTVVRPRQVLGIIRGTEDATSLGLPQ